MRDQPWVKPALLTATVLLGVVLGVRHLDLQSAAAGLPAQLGCGRRQSDALLLPRHRAVAPGDPDHYQPPVPARGLTVDADVLWARQFLLEGPAMERAVTFGDTQRLRRHVARLMAGEHVRVTAVGASVTSGAGAMGYGEPRTSWPGYVSQFEDWLKAAFPRSNATVNNAGMAGTFSGVFAQCFDTLIPPADIYILEQTTFDGTEPERCYCRDHYVSTPVQLGIERIIRRMMKQPGQPAVIMLNEFGFRFPNFGTFQRSVENNVLVMAQYYGLPTASLRAATWRRMLEGGHGFNVSSSVKLLDGGPIVPNYPLYYDQVHPWGPTGHRVLTELLIRTVQATAVSLNIQPMDEQESSHADELPLPPMTPGNYETNSSSCWLGDDFHTLVNTTSKFEWINERPDAVERKAQKWGFVATEPKAFLEFTIDTRVSAAADQGAKPNRVVLSYLASYEGMGTARVECLSGCQCEPVDIDGLWEQKASMLMTQEFLATPHAACRVRVSVRQKSSSSGHKFKVAGAVVLPAGTNEFGALDRLSVVVPQMFEGNKPRG